MVHIPCNIGGPERNARIGAGTALLGMSALVPMVKPARWAVGLLGAYGLVTGLTDYCFINQAVGRNSCPTAHRPHE